MRKKWTVHLCGLGAHPPEETTLETLDVLESARTSFCRIADAGVFRWIKRFVPALRKPASARQVVDAARAGDVALAVWGHPQFTGGLAAEVLGLCRRRAVPCVVHGAISPAGSAFARSVSFLGGDYGWQGLQAYELETLLADSSTVAPTLPLVVYAEDAAAARWGELAGALSAWPPGAQARVWPVGGRAEFSRPLSRLGEERLGGAVVLLSPARPGGHADGS